MTPWNSGLVTQKLLGSFRFREKRRCHGGGLCGAVPVGFTPHTDLRVRTGGEIRVKQPSGTRGQVTL